VQPHYWEVRVLLPIGRETWGREQNLWWGRLKPREINAEVDSRKEAARREMAMYRQKEQQ
jgi:hypothetical protein